MDLSKATPNNISPEQLEQIKKYADAHYDEFHYPHKAEGVYDISSNQEEKLFWVYKCWVQAIEQPEKGSGLEEYFSQQNLSFPLSSGFMEESRASVSAAGDLMAVDGITEKTTPHLFDEIEDFYLSTDLTVGNLESTVYGEAPIGRNSIPAMPAKMNTSVEMFDQFYRKGEGINFFTLANNHCWDYGEEGLAATQKVLSERNCSYGGTNSCAEEQEEASILEKNGIRFGIVSFTFDLNGNVCDIPWRVNQVRVNDVSCDLSLVERQVNDATEKKADIIIVNAHWGWEFEMYPHVNIVEAAHKIAEMGVDVIFGNHPHVAQPMEKYQYTKNGKIKECLIIYSMGDFVSYHPMTKDSHLTYSVRFDVVKGRTEENETATYVTDLKVLPIYIFAERTQGVLSDFRLLKFLGVCQDSLAGTCSLPLTPEEKEDLPRLKKLLQQVLLPASPGNLIEQSHQG